MTETAPARWKDGDTMLSFGLFAAVVAGMLLVRIADPTNWIKIHETAPIETCAPVPPTL